MDTSDKSPEMIVGHPNFEWIPGNQITDDDEYEYKHSERVQEEISLEEKVDISEPLEDEYAIQEMGKDK